MPRSTCELPEPLTTAPGPRLPKNLKSIPPERAPMPHQPPEVGAHNFKEVALGLDLEGALHEAERCLRCKKPRCVPGCPVGIDIPGFIAAIQEQDIKRSYQILKSHQRPAGGLRPRLPAGIAMRSHLRGGRQVQAGVHRPPGTLRGRCRHGPRLG